MKGAIILARRLWRIYFFTIAILMFLPLYPLFLYYCTSEKRFMTGFRLKKIFGRLICAVTGIRYQVHMEEPLDTSKAYVICANHTSYLDIVLSFAVIPVYFHMMAKAELTSIPLFNVFFMKQDIPVNRGSLKSSHRAFVRSASDISKGYSVCIFPEATIPHHTPRLGRFKNGPFKLAVDQQVPLLPVTFLNNWAILPDGRKAKHGGYPGLARIVIHKPINTRGMGEDDVLMLKNQVFDTIDSRLRA